MTYRRRLPACSHPDRRGMAPLPITGPGYYAVRDGRVLRALTHRGRGEWSCKFVGGGPAIYYMNGQSKNYFDQSYAVVPGTHRSDVVYFIAPAPEGSAQGRYTVHNEEDNLVDMTAEEVREANATQAGREARDAYDLDRRLKGVRASAEPLLWSAGPPGNWCGTPDAIPPEPRPLIDYTGRYATTSQVLEAHIHSIDYTKRTAFGRMIFTNGLGPSCTLPTRWNIDDGRPLRPDGSEFDDPRRELPTCFIAKYLDTPAPTLAQLQKRGKHV
jgi:hypothetical protein